MQSNIQQNNTTQQNNNTQNDMAQSNMQNYSYLSDYFNKQIKFRKLIKEIQKELKSKDYIKQGYTYDEFIKEKWNISKYVFFFYFTLFIYIIY